jgi:hypothetical protein
LIDYVISLVLQLTSSPAHQPMRSIGCVSGYQQVVATDVSVQRTASFKCALLTQLIERACVSTSISMLRIPWRSIAVARKRSMPNFYTIDFGASSCIIFCRYEKQNSQLQENETYQQLEALEKKWQASERVNHGHNLFILSKETESNFKPYVKQVVSVMKDYNNELKARDPVKIITSAI